MRPLIALLLVGASLAQAAPADKPLSPEECYADVSTAAEILQVCLVNQTHEHECSIDQQALEVQIKSCRQFGGTQERIELARQIGAALIPGDPAQSLFAQTVARKHEAVRLLRANENRFRARFNKLLDYSAQAFTAAFDTPDCPLAFQGSGENYLMSGLLIVKRQGEAALPQLDVAEEEQTHLFFERMARGKCYRADTTTLTPQVRVEPDQPQHIYNLSRSMISRLPDEGRPILVEELRKGAAMDTPFRIGKPLTVKVRHYPTLLQGKGHHHLCDSTLACLRLRANLIDDYQAYNRALREMNQATACLIYLDPNRSGEISIDQLYGMDCTAANGNRLLAESSRKITEIGARLFR